MRRFTDRLGRPWAVDVNVSQIKRVRDLLKVDLFRLIDDGLRPLAELLGDPVKLVDLLFVLVMDQAKAQQVGEDDFGRGMAGESIQLAAEAFVEELIDFFPETRDRLVLRKIVAKQKEIHEAMTEHNCNQIDTLIPAEEAARIARVLTRRPSSGAAPESSASTPEPGGSAT